MEAGWIVQIGNMVSALVFVVALMGLLALVLQRLGLHEGIGRGAHLKRPARRLQIVETLSLDTRRKIVLLRCDEKEHLLMIGANEESVLDKNISPPLQSETDVKN